MVVWSRVSRCYLPHSPFYCIENIPGVQFQGLRDSGDPVDLALEYQDQGADEIVFLDISATGIKIEFSKILQWKV